MDVARAAPIFVAFDSGELPCFSGCSCPRLLTVCFERGPVKFRLLVAVICTASSYMALRFSLAYPTWIWSTAWTAYFTILYFWVRYDRAPKALVVTGTVLGVLSVIGSYLMALLAAAPSIALMLHVLRRTFFPDGRKDARPVEPNEFKGGS